MVEEKLLVADSQLSQEQEHNITNNTSTAIKKRNLPIWMITHKDDKKIRENLKTQAWKKCDEYVAAFVNCSKDAGLMIFPKCSDQREVLQRCLVYYQKDEFIDEQVDLYLAEKLRQLELKAEEQKKAKLNK
ncbi:hypothetical protein QEN19_002821 [Hanseniaspora menglaensis]